MPEFMKPKEFFEKYNNSIVFQPCTLEGTERFSVWSVRENKFYNEGETIEVDGQKKEVNKYIKLTDEQKKVFGRNLKTRREVIIDGKEYIYDMPMTVDEKLRETMKTVTALKRDPLAYNYTVSKKKTGDEAWNVEYEVSLGDNVGQVPEPDIDFDDIETTTSSDEDSGELVLSPIEERYVAALKKKYSDYADRDKYSEESLIRLLTNKAKVKGDRAKRIIDEHLS